MRTRGIVLTLVVVLGVVFAVLNWGSLTAPLPLNLVVVSVQWPLGLTLLAAVVAVAVVFFLLSLLERAAQLRHVTSLQRQLEATRARLDDRRNQEEGRLGQRFEEALTQLRSSLDERLESVHESLAARLAMRLEAQEARSTERLDALAQRVVALRDELAADIAQAEDALARRLGADEPSA